MSHTSLAWLPRRLVIVALLLLLVSSLIFAATQALPGDVALMILGKDAMPEQIRALRTELKLDRPLLEQYVGWLSSLARGDLGQSYAARIPVADLIGPRIVNSFALVSISMLVSIPLAVVFGVWSAHQRDGVLDHVLTWLSLLTNALPEFVLGVLLVVVFSTNVFHLLPAISMISVTRPLYEQWPVLVLPCATLVLLQATYLYRLIRGSVIDVLLTDYIEFAHLRGLSMRRVLFRHALPNAVAPAIQAAATVFAVSVGGVVTVEYVFSYPGIGSALVDAVGNRDIAVVQSIVLLIAATFFLANMFADIVGALLTPPGRGAAA